MDGVVDLVHCRRRNRKGKVIRFRNDLSLLVRIFLRFEFLAIFTPEEAYDVKASLFGLAYRPCRQPAALEFIKMSFVYVLALEDHNYYVGKSDNVEEDLAGKGAQWTKLHKPLRIVERFPCRSEFNENNHTKRCMQHYGTDNVRGGSYCQVNLSGKSNRLLCLAATLGSR